MLNKVMKISFTLVGAITGFTISKTIFDNLNLALADSLELFLFIIISVLAGILFYTAANKIICTLIEILDKLEDSIQNITLYELIIGVIGLIIGLIVANLITIPFNRIEIIGLPISISVNVIFGCLGIAIVFSKKHEIQNGIFFSKFNNKLSKTSSDAKILDTSVIIDGRIVDILRSGFIEGELIVPSFVLEELRHIADSSDTLKRNRGRRGLDVLNMIQKELKHPVRIEDVGVPEGGEVDSELLNLAKKVGGKVVTIDYNLNKVASFKGVQVLNINELSNAVKPIALPGEEMTIQVIKDGKENGQGIGYLDDGTMIVIDGGRRFIGENVNVTVTSVLQTAAGRMIFAKPKLSDERAM
ncbi:MAG TPA: TRAM domain-containing protein [Clostridiaceae bacterium]|nr:TRAM domain-containing protein [Clostridiaceae bacterium]